MTDHSAIANLTDADLERMAAELIANVAAKEEAARKRREETLMGFLQEMNKEVK